MGMLWTNAGINQWQITGGNSASSQKLWGLFVNNYTPLVTTVIGDLTEPSNSGYSRLGAMGWNSFTPSGGIASGSQGTETWTFTANAFAESIYGWFLMVNPGSGLILAGLKRFAAPHLIPAVGESFPLTFSSSLQKLP
jgi:hypothetical protein